MSFVLDVAARTLWQEARGEPAAGQVAVAHVMWNRVRDGRWGPNLATVCLWRAQFSGWYMPSDPNFKGACTLADNDPLLGRLQQLIIDAEHADDPTGGALFYYSTSLKDAPSWSKTMTYKGQWGRQKFWTDRGNLVA
jgi:spore germination cell wall hydrolase CwlJ-like protein